MAPTIWSRLYCQPRAPWSGSAAVPWRVFRTRSRLPSSAPLVVLRGHGDTRLNQLAERVDVMASTSLRMVDRLIDAHLVTRRENKADRRESPIALTVEGARLVPEVSATAGRDRHHRRRDAPAGSLEGGRGARRVRPGRRRSHTEHRDFHPARLVTMAALSLPT